VPPIEAEKARAAEVTTEKRPLTTWRRAYFTVSPMNTNVSGITAIRLRRSESGTMGVTG
jgi:hypothetical protein